VRILAIFLFLWPTYLLGHRGHDLDLAVAVFPERPDISSPAVNVAVVQDDITSWTGDFWEKEFTDSLIPAHGSRDINGDKRFNDELDMGADEVQWITSTSFSDKINKN